MSIHLTQKHVGSKQSQYFPVRISLHHLKHLTSARAQHYMEDIVLELKMSPVCAPTKERIANETQIFCGTRTSICWAHQKSHDTLSWNKQLIYVMSDSKALHIGIDGCAIWRLVLLSTITARWKLSEKNRQQVLLFLMFQFWFSYLL